MKYSAELSSLSSYVHGRNARLLKIALLGKYEGLSPKKYEGLSPEEITADLIEAGGEPRLTDAEVNRAVAKAFAAENTGTVPLENTGTVPLENRRANHANRTSAPKINEKAQGFVREMITAGGGEGSSARLKALSPIPIANDPISDAYAFVNELLPESDTDLYFSGTPFTKRTRESLRRRVSVAFHRLCETRHKTQRIMK